MKEMLPFHGKRHASKSMSGPTRQLMNDGRPRQRHSMTKTANVGDILRSSSRTNTHSRYFREHQRSGQLLNRNSRRQDGYDSDELDDEPEQSRKFIQPPKSLIYSGESSWAAFEMKFKRFVREQMFSEKEAKDYLC
ncbi:hypothetical protein PoB_000014400 [Plakobranchus ocellatus]|uniref:Uncharacterized protein n=1 Tax=Plakobranchus ocellatus TaxID=259542 RepID=A0AAV3XUK4_9GAST|nr:hypothetical protein PoB_000014400 [Plakobranchus ocellatus]